MRSLTASRSQTYAHDERVSKRDQSPYRDVSTRLFTDLSTASRARRPSQKPMFTGENGLLLTHG
jgi:hypothetical protein